MTKYTEHNVRRMVSRDIARAINTKNELLKGDLNMNGMGLVYDCDDIADEYCVIMSEMHKNPCNTGD